MTNMLRRVLPTRSKTPSENTQDSPLSPAVDDAACSVLDLGAARITALVVQISSGEASVLAMGLADHPPIDPAMGRADFGALVAAAEAALVAAEDEAGAVPRRVVLGVEGSSCIVGTGKSEHVRPQPSAPVETREVERVLADARATASVAARRLQLAEHGKEQPLGIVNEAILSIRLDDRHVTSAVGATGSRFLIEVAEAFAPPPVLRHLKDVADALDLEHVGSLALPFALGAALSRNTGEPAIVVDAGNRGTQVILVGEHGTEAGGWLPIGAQALEARLQERLGIDALAARQAVEAHTHGAGLRGPAGATGARVVSQLARHHADVWLDALEVGCGEIARGRNLPPRIFLCGTSALMPEMRQALASGGWHATLPFPRPPTVRVLAPSDIPGVRLPEGFSGGSETVPILCLASAFALM